MENLRKIRKERDLTMKEVGIAIGVGESTISQYETGKRQPDQQTLLKLADYFDVSVDYLLGKEERGSAGINLNKSLSLQERKLINDYRKCSETAKKRIAEYIDLWLDFKPD